jgi:nicotinamidase-related amidase
MMVPVQKRLPANATLIIIDVQNGFDDPFWGPRNNPEAEIRIGSVLEKFRKSGRDVIHVKHDSIHEYSPLRPGQHGNRIKEEAAPLPKEPVLHKTVNSAFIGTGLEQMLREKNVSALVLCGFTTNHCVSTTARMAGNLGFETYVLSDGTATFDMRTPHGRMIPAEVMHELGLTELHGEFATVLSTAELLEIL